MNIIVTGASRGIGYHTVLELVNTGNYHILAIARSKENLTKLEDEFENIKNGKLSTISFDLSEKNVSPLIEEISQVFKLNEGNKIDILLNAQFATLNMLYSYFCLVCLIKDCETNITHTFSL